MNNYQLNLELLYSNLQPKFQDYYNIPFGEEVKAMIKKFYDGCETEEFGVKIHSKDTAEDLLQNIERLRAVHKYLPTFKSSILDAVLSTTNTANSRVVLNEPEDSGKQMQTNDINLSA